MPAPISSILVSIKFLLSAIAETGLRHSIRRPGEGHKTDQHNGARFHLTFCDFFGDGELLNSLGRPQRHYEPAAHSELLDQRRGDMLEGGCHDYCIERAAFLPTVVAVDNLNAHILIAEIPQQLRSGFAQ